MNRIELIEECNYEDLLKSAQTPKLKFIPKIVSNQAIIRRLLSYKSLQSCINQDSMIDSSLPSNAYNRAYSYPTLLNIFCESSFNEIYIEPNSSSKRRHESSILNCRKKLKLEETGLFEKRQDHDKDQAYEYLKYSRRNLMQSYVNRLDWIDNELSKIKESEGSIQMIRGLELEYARFDSKRCALNHFK